jgi:predicted phage terminase large subunit-like protein
MGSAAFAAQYLQDPIPAEGAMLRKDWLTFCESPGHLDGDIIVQSWDTANKAGNRNDYSACLTFRIRKNNEIYLEHVFRERLEFPDLLRKVHQHAAVHSPNHILIENLGSGISLIQSLQLPNVIRIDPKGDKATRMLGCTAMLESGKVRFVKDERWNEIFLREYLQFPEGTYDDQIDALSQFLKWHQEHVLSGFFWYDMGFDEPGVPSGEAILAMRFR